MGAVGGGAIGGGVGGGWRNIMRLPENLKEILRGLSKEKDGIGGEEEVRNLVEEETRRIPDEEEEDEEEIHSLPAGVWPKQGPRPGKLGTVLYYISLALSVLGIITMIKCTYVKQDSSRPSVLLLSF